MDVPYITQNELIFELKKLNLYSSIIIKNALEQSIKSHINQKRDDGSSYLEQHIFPVTMSIIDYFNSSEKSITPELIAGALLHDTLEDDKELTDMRFINLFGDKLYDIIKPLSKPDYNLYPGKTKKDRKISLNKEYYTVLELAPEESKIIKLADRLNNVSCLHLSPKKGKMAFYIEETEEFYLPFAKKIADYYYKRLYKLIQELKLS